MFCPKHYNQYIGYLSSMSNLVQYIVIVIISEPTYLAFIILFTFITESGSDYFTSIFNNHLASFYLPLTI